MIVMLATLMTSYTSWGIPIVRSLGCGQADSLLSIDRRTYCCQHFQLNCNPGMSVENPSMKRTFYSPEQQKQEEQNVTKTVHSSSSSSVSSLSSSSSSSLSSTKLKAPSLSTDTKLDASITQSTTLVLKVRTLGQSCTSAAVRCASGLQCRMGVCMRDKSSRHFQRLIAVGKQVESAERLSEDEEEQDETEQVKIRGQSVEIDNVAARLALKHRRQDAIGLSDRAAVHGDEEDELTANVADYLSARGKSLSKTEWTAIRNLIAGTMDERAERDEEVDQAESAQEELAKLDREKPQQKQNLSVHTINNRTADEVQRNETASIVLTDVSIAEQLLLQQNQKQHQQQQQQQVEQQNQLQTDQQQSQQYQQDKYEQHSPQPSYSQCSAS